MLGLAIGFLVLSLIASVPTQVRQAHLALLVWLGLMYAMQRFKFDQKTLAHLLLFGLYSHFIYISIYSGGIYSPAMGWILLLPATTLLLGLRATAFWLTVSFACYFLFAAAHTYGLIRPQLLDAEMSTWTSGLNISMVLSLAFYVTRYEQMNRSHIQNLLSQTQSLTAVQKQLIKAQSHKDEFIAVVSHELRTPMNTVLGFTELLKDLVESNKSRDIIAHIQHSAKQLLQVISDILDFSQLQAHKLELMKDHIDPRNLTAHAQQKFALDAKKQNLELKVWIDPDTVSRIYVDELRISQVLDQLLSNAIKFTENGVIELRLRNRTDHIRIEVHDTGIGIQESQLDNIFAGFQHGSTEVQRRYGGTGLGLSICKQLVALHQGKIGVNSALNVGSVFWIELPIDSRLLNTEPVASNPKAKTRFSLHHYLTQQQLIFDAWAKSKQQPILQDEDTKPFIFMAYIFCLIVGTLIYANLAPFAEAKITNYALCGVLVTGVILQFFGLRFDLIVNGILAYGFVHLFVLSLYSGGAMSITALWFSIIPLAPLYLYTRKRVLFWLLTPITFHILLAYCTTYEWAPVPPQLAVKSLAWALANLSALTLFVLFLPLLYKMIRKHTKKSLQKHNEQHLKAKQELLAQQQIKNEFIANVSHELRTPMNAIIGFNDLLNEEILDNPEAQRLNALVSQSAKHLITVIDDILDYSQLESGKLALKNESFDVWALINNAYQMFKSASEQRNVALKLNMQAIPQWVNGDRQRLMQILVNLLSNALKFTAKGEITLDVKEIRNGLMFEIHDTGSGIETEKIQQIFGQFEQVGTLKSHRTQGHGLGLAITKRLVDAQQGKIHVRSEIGTGSCFQIWLPLRESQAPAVPMSPGRIKAQKHEDNLSILIVDDHPLNRLLAQQILHKTWPHAYLKEAENGLQALELLKQHTYHLILMDVVIPEMDVVIPEMDGVTATQNIRSNFNSPTKNIPILGLTANANLNARQQCLEAGMNDVVFKPFSRDELLSSIQRLIKPHLSQAA